MNENTHKGGNGDMIVAVGYKVDLTASTEKSLTQRIEDAFKEAVASKLNGKVPEHIRTKVDAMDKVYHPILSFLIQDEYSGTKTTVQIPIGQANPDQNIYFAGINGEDYKQYSSLEGIGDEAAEIFKHNYLVDVMGI